MTKNCMKMLLKMEQNWNKEKQKYTGKKQPLPV